MKIYKGFTILIVSLALAILFSASNLVFAATVSISIQPENPNGDNGWYKSVYIDRELSGLGCSGIGIKSSPPTGNYLIRYYIHGPALFSRINDGDFKKNLSCGDGPFPNPPEDATPIWSRQIKFEQAIESFKILSPKNNFNTNEPTIKVSGTAKTVSGVSSVIVNEKQANIAGESWSVTVPLKKGLNQINASSTSVAGNTASDSILVFYLPQLGDPATQESTSIFETNTSGETLGESENKKIDEAAITQEATISATPSAESTQSGGLVKNTFSNNKILTTLFVLIILSSAGVLAFKTEAVSRFVINKFLKR